MIYKTNVYEYIVHIVLQRLHSLCGL